MSGDLHGKSAFVVGASRGIGKAIAEEYADRGADVAAVARSSDDLETLAASLPTECVPIECDVRDDATVERAVTTAADCLGAIDVAVNSAGTIARGRLHEADEADVTAVIDVNLLGALRVSKHVLPALMETEGTLLHVTSEAGSVGVPELPSYCASKGGLDAAVRQLAVDYGSDGVSVVAIAPGTTKTSMNEVVRVEDPSWVEERAENVPYGRLGTPEDISDLAAFLARDQSDYLTGEVIHVDGGSTA
ncbi:SDR family NAD(P)-dependent oxidoreductase [Natrialba asiatica]|uniref:3-ketoacyl-(Acyl-carrier-protein) reductase n=1 Tax=Natrialba asiatica (strain ATCC 700177 / DSM 12278 / JCM 9576 / FERM P-10747 / NBRC 102637 / 172P1) TaxID=29540 RepID=M0B5V0_NATA1|nr:SDR family oxidoreductase [Natrialba asiatica]ELZ05902.1 3-ketoacyl-(acyl-carrier-protein) reductase [Natrialba asiatica DSM 12278]